MTVAGGARVDAALSAAGIPPEQRCTARSARLTEGVRALYDWTLRFFAVGDPPPADEQPAAAVVLAGSACVGPSFRSCCQVLNFFASVHNAERYLSAHPDAEGFAISIPEAVAVGESVFSDVLDNA